MAFTKELTKLGLKDKEAAVYLACLELGPATAQQISRKSKVVRATTYVELESLMQMGMVTKYKEGKKTLFSAEPPRQLNRLLEKQAEELEHKKEGLDELLPELQVLMKAAGGRPSVRYFEGKEGLRAMRQEIVMHSKTDSTIYNFTPSDYLEAIFPDDERTYFKQRSAKGLKSKTIFTTKSETLKQELLRTPTSALAERVFVDSSLFSSVSGFTIFEDRVAIGTFAGKLMGVIIESPEIATMMRQVFELAWIGGQGSDGSVRSLPD